MASSEYPGSKKYSSSLPPLSEDDTLVSSYVVE